MGVAGMVGGVRDNGLMGRIMSVRDNWCGLGGGFFGIMG